ncbi:MAG: hypothetical protein P8K73_03115 [Methylophilaceae bacterium]|nr:hypothetical protein [Methylophilaceae bacterium]
MNPNNELHVIKSNKIVNYLTLFTSSGTIICCALPALLVSIGAGAALSSLISIFPKLIILSTYKIPIFIGAFIMLIISGIIQYLVKNLPCPADKKLANECKKTRRVSLIMYFLSLGIFTIGFLFAFILPFLLSV